MKKIIGLISTFLALIAHTPIALAQSPAFNHLTVYVMDLQKSAGFYENVMQLKKIAEPFKDGKHIWFKIGEHSQLHVVGGAKAIIAHDINIHLAFHVTSLPDFMKHLDQLEIKYGNWKGDSKSPQLRPDGIRQIYFQDPDGYWIEVNDDKF
ncbi:MAG: VOC family protein [Ginsengibacter sp.]